MTTIAVAVVVASAFAQAAADRLGRHRRGWSAARCGLGVELRRGAKIAQRVECVSNA